MSGQALGFISGGGITKGGQKLHEVYLLVHKETKAVNYVGRTTKGFLNRFKQHMGSSSKKEWIKIWSPYFIKVI